MSLIVPILASTILFCTSLKAKSPIFSQVFETPETVAFFIADSEKRDLEIRVHGENHQQCSLTGELCQEVLALLRQDSRLQVAQNSFSLNRDLRFERLELVADHKQHRSFFIEFSKENEQKGDFVTILLDPGHGGVDRGAANGKIKEKDITLKVAQLLQKQLERDQVQVLLTRSEDCYLSLKERVFLASHLDADLFLSLHTDSFENSSVHGASLFSWGEESKKNTQSSLLKAHNDEKFLGISLDKKQAELKPVLAALVSNVQSYHEQNLGKKILIELSKVTSLHNPRVQKAPFFVIKHHLCPSLLIELGFLSHDQTAQKFAHDPLWVERLVAALAEGAVDYLQDVYVFLREKNYLYEIKAGDTLSSIAQKHGCTLKNLIDNNKLENDRIYPGQKIYLP